MFDNHPPSPAHGLSPASSSPGTTGPGSGRPAAGGANASKGDLHIYDRLGVVIKYWKIVCAVVVLVVSGMMYRAYSTIPMYRATAQLLIQDEQTAQSDFKESYLAYTDPEPYRQTQYKILQGRELARRAVRRLKLENEPEFNGVGPKPPRVAQLTTAIKSKVLSPFMGTPAPPRPGRVNEIGLVGAFQGRVSVEPVRNSLLVNVSFTAADAELAQRAVNVVADEYVAQNLESRLKTTQDELVYFRSEVKRMETVVQKREEQLTQYRQTQNAGSLDDRQNIVGSRLTTVNEQLLRARTLRINAETLYNTVSQPGFDPETLTPVLTNANVQGIRQRLSEARDRRATLLDRYGERHPSVIENAERVRQLEEQLRDEIAKVVDSIKTDYQQALTTERRFEGELAREQAQVQELETKGVDYSVLQKQAESDREVYQQLLQKEKELNVAANSRANNVSVVDTAELPGAPFTPDIRRAWMFALAMGLGFGVAAAFAIDYLDDTVKTPDDIRWRLKVHFLGLVPKVRGNSRPLLSDSVPPSFGEAFRALRTALVIRSGSGDTRIVATTSAQPLEGKTTTAVNTALALAIGGARVLLIDADMRRPSVHKALRMPNQKGLSELLQAQARMREVVRTTVHPNLLAVTAGAPPANPSELLASDRMRALLEQLEQRPFDWVIIDTPPVLAVTDAVILAPLVSAVTFVVGAEMTRWRLAERAIETLQSSNPRSISAVLNRVDFDRNRYYYTRYYGQHYYSYYAEDVEKAS